MADIWSSLYDALQAPANERTAREDAMRSAPTYQQLLSMTNTSGAAPGKTGRFDYPQGITGSSVAYGSNPDQVMAQTTKRWGPNTFSPSMTAAERLAAIKQINGGLTNDFPTPGSPKKDPIDITVRGGSTAAYAPWGALSRSLAYNALHPDPAPAADTSFPGASVRYANAVGPQMPQQPGVNEVAGTMKPGYQLGDGALAFATQNAKQPINGLSGLLASLFGGSGTAVGSKLDTRGPGPGELYKLANQAGQMKAILAPRTGTTAAGYVYKNGQQVGTTRAPGESAASQYDKAAAKARASSPDNGGNPSWW